MKPIQGLGPLQQVDYEVGMILQSHHNATSQCICLARPQRQGILSLIQCQSAEEVLL